MKVSRILLKNSIFDSVQFNSFNNDLVEDMGEILIKSAVKMSWDGTQDNKWWRMSKCTKTTKCE